MWCCLRTTRGTGWLGILLAGMMVLRAEAQEFRAFWADAFHDGFRTADQVTKLVADLRAANCNAVVVQVRKRGDAYYNSRFEPKAIDIAPDFDPLQDLINKAHNTNAGAWIDVHAWIVTYPIWNNETTPPTAPNHPYNLHPDWLTRNQGGQTWSGNYVFDPGHPEAQQHTFNVAMDIITNYNVDGLNFDYIRYFGYEYGYNPVAVARFNAQQGRTGQPAQQDTTWMQWRRDQVTALLRKVYISAMAVRPEVKISADTIGGTPGPTSDTVWTNSSQAYTLRLQDWRSWMEEGILDINIPMVYLRQNNPTYATDYINWNNFIKDRRFGRHVVIGPGIYLNSISNALYQMRLARVPSPGGNEGQGICGYSYAVPASNTIANLQATFLATLTQPSAYDPVTPAIYAEAAAVPAMPWKTAPTVGHIKGMVRNATNGAAFDWAAVQIAGPVSRALRSDGTGFYGGANLPPGQYTVVAAAPGFQSATGQCTVAAGAVANVDLQLMAENILVFQNLAVSPGGRGAVMSWTTVPASQGEVEFVGLARARISSSVTSNTAHRALLAGLTPGTSYTVRAVARAYDREFYSEPVVFRTGGTNDLDNPEAFLTGSWSLATSSTDKYLANYSFASTTNGAPNRFARYTPDLAASGLYDVHVWYPAGGNRSTNAPHTVAHDGGSVTVSVNQTGNGGDWRLLATGLPFARGTNGYVEIANNSGETGKVIMADGVRFVYREAQDTPATPAVPAWWNAGYFGSNALATADVDGDGYPTWMEYRLGTDPTAAGSRLNLAIGNHSTLGAVFTPVLPDRAYALEFATNLAGGPWLTLTNAVAITNQQGVIYLNPTNATQGFYRLKVEW